MGFKKSGWALNPFSWTITGDRFLCCNLCTFTFLLILLETIYWFIVLPFNVMFEDIKEAAIGVMVLLFLLPMMLHLFVSAFLLLVCPNVCPCGSKGLYAKFIKVWLTYYGATIVFYLLVFVTSTLSLLGVVSWNMDKDIGPMARLWDTGKSESNIFHTPKQGKN